jgi:hypothetical protein
MHHAISFAISTLFLFACSANLLSPWERSGEGPLLHFEDQWLALDYPRTWNLHLPGDASFKWHPPIDLGGDLIVALGDPQYRSGDTYFRFIRITRRLKCACDSLQPFIDDSYQSLDLRYPLALSPFKPPETITVSGIDSPQRAYRIYWGEPAYDLRDIWVRQGENLFLISISTGWTDLDDLSAFESLADTILRSLVLK